MSRHLIAGRAALAAAAFAVFSASPAMAQVRAGSGVDLAASDRTQERIERIENQLRDLQGAVYASDRPQRPLGGTQAYPPQGAVLPGAGPNEADMAIRLLDIERSMAELTGRVEELSYRLERQQQILDRLEGMSSPEFGAPQQLPNIQGVQNPDLAAGGPTDLLNSAGPATNGLQLPDDPDRAFDEAYTAVLGAQYDEAETRLEAFVEQFPDSPQLPEAKFMLGEIYLATGANGEAARVFLDHVSNHKDDPRSPEAYLKLGIAFKRLNRPEEACRVFNAGVAKFPNMEPRLMSEYVEERAATACN